MPEADRVTWTACPVCSRDAAVGWLGARPVEIDCTSGCRLTVDQVQVVADGLRWPAAPPSPLPVGDRDTEPAFAPLPGRGDARPQR